MKNQHGLDCDYFKRKLKILIRDIDNYNPYEMDQELDNMKLALNIQNNTGNSKEVLRKNAEILFKQKRIVDHDWGNFYVGYLEGAKQCNK